KSGGGFIAVFQGERVISPRPQSVPKELIAAVKSQSPPRVIMLAEAHAATYRVTLPVGHFVIVSYGPTDSIAASLSLVRRVSFLPLPAVLLIAAFGGYWLATRNLAPLQAMANQAHLISSRNLDARLEIGDAANELVMLSGAFNELLSRLDQSFDSMRR